MWKKDETPKEPPADFETRDKPPAAKSTGTNKSLIGRSLVVEGSIRGDQELLVEGRVEGNITLPKNTVTVGNSGRVQATIEANTIIVEGTVEGDLKGGEQVEIRRSGNVLGNIISPRVGLEDGAQFKGNIDMSPKSKSASFSDQSRPGSSSSKDSSQPGNEQSIGKTADSKLSG